MGCVIKSICFSILAEERHTPMGVVLLQEILRYNHLVTQISNSLVDLEKGIKGSFILSLVLIVQSALSILLILTVNCLQPRNVKEEAIKAELNTVLSAIQRV